MGHVDEWVDTAHLVWSEVIGLCGFGTEALIKESPDQTCTEALGWAYLHKKCGQVLAVVC